MHIVANTGSLVDEGIISREAADIIQTRGRETMVSLAVNAILCFGILSATLGLIFWLATALSVAIGGGLLLGAGLLILAFGGPITRMFGNASALIGAGMLIGGAGLELTDKYPAIASVVMIPGGALIAALALRAFLRGGLTTRFVQGSIGLMGAALHLAGIGFELHLSELEGIWPVLFCGYATLLMLALGRLTDVRLITALAIAPFAQMLDTGTFYWHAVYAFYSPESTLSILQMTLAVGVGLWVASRSAERTGRHGRIFATMAFIIANLCALVGSLWGDRVGYSYRPFTRSDFEDSAAFYEARHAFRESLIYIGDDTYAALWAFALAGIIAFAAHRSNRALFNTGITFAAIHAYTQVFESLHGEPLAYAIGGFGAVALAWGVWQMNRVWFTSHQAT